MAECEEIEAALVGNEENIARCQTRLGEIGRKFAEVRVDERESARRARKEDLVNKLKQLYGDEVVSIQLPIFLHFLIEFLVIRKQKN